MILTKRNRSFAAEWDCQDGIIISWPHAGTDWAYMLDGVTACYVEIAKAILDDDDLTVLGGAALGKERIVGAPLLYDAV